MEPTRAWEWAGGIPHAGFRALGRATDVAWADRSTIRYRVLAVLEVVYALLCAQPSARSKAQSTASATARAAISNRAFAAAS